MPSIFEELGSALRGKLGEKLSLSGGVMTGPLEVPAPTGPNQVATSGQVTILEDSIGNYGDFVSSNADVTVSVFDTTANILARTGDPKGTVAVASDTDVIYYWSGAVWSESSLDEVQGESVSAARTINLSGDTEANIRLRESDPAGTIMYGTDTSYFYIFDGTDWQQYHFDS